MSLKDSAAGDFETSRDLAAHLRAQDSAAMKTLARELAGGSEDEVLQAMEKLLATVADLGEKLEGAENESLRDGLTGLHNRRYFDDQLGKACAETMRAGGLAMLHPHYMVALIDMDGLKPINDHMGHAAGDIAIKSLGEHLQKVARSSDDVVRLGGDEFAMLIRLKEDDDPGRAARAIRTRIANAIDNMDFLFDGKTYPLNASAGFALIKPGMDADAVMKLADERLYQDKASAPATRHGGPPNAI